jgi:hypothetical protein
MADDEDSAQDGPAEEISGNVTFAPEGPYCRLINGARPPAGIPHLVMPPSAKKNLATAHRKLDAAFWRHVIEELDKAAETGRLPKGLATQLATCVRRGCAGILPASWIRAELPENTPSGAGLYFGDQRQMAAMYRLAADREHIRDTKPRQTIIERCGISERTWERWSVWFNQNLEFVAAELEMLLLEAPFLLEDLEEFRAALLITGDPDTEEREVTDPDR